MWDLERSGNGSGGLPTGRGLDEPFSRRCGLLPLNPLSSPVHVRDSHAALHSGGSAGTAPPLLRTAGEGVYVNAPGTPSNPLFVGLTTSSPHDS